MALVVFLKGVNVGGYRTFRPRVLAREFPFDVVNVGAAGTFVVRTRISQAKLRAEMTRRLPFETDVMICSGTDVSRLASGDPFTDQPSGPDIVRFVSVLAKCQQPSPPVPLYLPTNGEWCLKVITCQGRFVFG